VATFFAIKVYTTVSLVLATFTNTITKGTITLYHAVIFSLFTCLCLIACGEKTQPKPTTNLNPVESQTAAQSNSEANKDDETEKKKAASSKPLNLSLPDLPTTQAADDVDFSKAEQKIELKLKDKPESDIKLEGKFYVDDTQELKESVNGGEIGIQMKTGQ